MKKKIYSVCFISLVIAFSIMNFNFSPNNEVIGILSLANIEALASNESMGIDEFHKLGCDPVNYDIACRGLDGKPYSYAVPYNRN